MRASKLKENEAGIPVGNLKSYYIYAQYITEFNFHIYCIYTRVLLLLLLLLLL